MRIYLIRHADPDYPNNTITPAGHLEARALVPHLARLGVDRIFCSPLGRALHTMQYTADALKLPHTVEDWTAEMPLHLHNTPDEWGGHNGRLMAWDVPGEVVRRHKPLPAHHDWHTREPFHDPSILQAYLELQTHSDAFLARLGYEREPDGHTYRIVRPHRERIALFCHLGFGLTWLSHLLGMPLTLMWSSFWLPPTSITTILFDERSKTHAVPRILGMGDVSHLHAAGLPIQPAGIKANFE